MSGESLVASVVPDDVGRPAWDLEQTRKDEELLRWVERFRFVTAELVAERFGVSWQRANARLRRLEKVGLVSTDQRHVCEARAVFVTNRAATLLGVGRRRTPRPDVQREHELLIVHLVIQAELRHPAARVLTERECRRAERDEPGRWSLADVAPSGRDRRHWPDLVVVRPDGGRVAIEVELSLKSPQRLRSIIDSHLNLSTFDAVRYFVRDPAVARRLCAIVDLTPPWLDDGQTNFGLAVLPGTPDAAATEIRRLDRERRRDQPSVVRPRDVVQVPHGGGDVGVAHPLLDAQDVRLGMARVPKVCRRSWNRKDRSPARRRAALYRRRSADPSR